MYKHILLPTDGSELSRQAVASGILFAKNNGAAVIGLHAVPKLRQDLLDAWVHHDAHFAQRRKAMYDRFADECLEFVANSALAEGVPCLCRKVADSEPHQAILDTARQERCDLIVMASHGWTGNESSLLGSETLKVLHDSPVPVLVYKRPARQSKA